MWVEKLVLRSGPNSFCSRLLITFSHQSLSVRHLGLDGLAPCSDAKADNQPKVTMIIKDILKEDYNYDSTNTFRALYRTFTECCFVEDEGEIVFYKNSDGRVAREFASDAFDYPVKPED